MLPINQVIAERVVRLFLKPLIFKRIRRIVADCRMQILFVETLDKLLHLNCRFFDRRPFPQPTKFFLNGTNQAFGIGVTLRIGVRR